MVRRPSYHTNDDPEVLLAIADEVVLALAQQLVRFRTSLAARDTQNQALAAENTQLQERVRELELQCAEVRAARVEGEAESRRLREELVRCEVREAERRDREAEVGVRRAGTAVRDVNVR